MRAPPEAGPRARNALAGGPARRYARQVLPTGRLAAFALLSFALIVIPGPNVLFVISRSMIGIGASLAVTGRKD
jgi:hypothetical protein